MAKKVGSSLKDDQKRVLKVPVKAQILTLSASVISLFVAYGLFIYFFDRFDGYALQNVDKTNRGLMFLIPLLVF